MMLRRLLFAFMGLFVALPCGAHGEPASRIGLFLGAAGPDAVDAAEVRRGVELAIAERTNAGTPAALVAAADGGQWGAGAGELVRLVYSEGIRAVLGPVDGRSAHLAEQVVTRAKGQFLMLTPWASDPTLTQIKIPWFFRLVPDDGRQADALLSAIGSTRSPDGPVLVVVASHYDSRVGADAFARAARGRGLKDVHELPLAQDGGDIDRVVADVRRTRPAALVVCVPPDLGARLVRGLRDAGVTAPLYGSLRLASPAFLAAAGEAADGMVLAAPAEFSGPVPDRFSARYGRVLSAPAAYGYDAAAVLIDALNASGAADTDAVRAALAATHRNGVTGSIAFDASGNRIAPAPLARVQRGHLVPIGPAVPWPVAAAAEPAVCE